MVGRQGCGWQSYLVCVNVQILQLDLSAADDCDGQVHWRQEEVVLSTHHHLVQHQRVAGHASHLQNLGLRVLRRLKGLNHRRATGRLTDLKQGQG